MNLMLRILAPFALVGTIALAGIFNFLPFGGQPFRPIEDFVLFGTEGVHLAEDSQSTSGDIGSNKKITIAEKVKVVGNLFAGEIHLAEKSEIDGNVFAKKLKIAENVTIFGTTSKDISFPVAKIPEIPPFTPGAHDITVATSNQIIPAGNYRDITIKESASAILSGTYNIRSLELKQNAAILFDATTTINIKDTLKLAQKTIVNPKPTTLSVQSIILNYAGKKSVTIGERAILGFKLIAPKAKVHISEDSIIRGNMWAKQIFIGERSTLRNTTWFFIPAKIGDIVQVGPRRIYVNVVEVNFTSDATIEDAGRIARLLGGQIKGFGPTTNLYSFFVPTKSIEELNEAIEKVRSLNDPKVEGVFPAIPIRLFPASN